MNEKDIKYIMERYKVDFGHAYGMSEVIQSIMKEQKISLEEACKNFDVRGDSIVKERNSKNMNIYQIIAIIFAILVIISTITMGADSSIEGSVPFVFLISGLTACLFMYGFGEIIKNTKSCKNYLKEINNSLNNK